MEEDKKVSIPTGSCEPNLDYKIIDYPLDKYRVKIKLTQDNKFIEVMEVAVNKEFISFKQRMSHTDVHDINEFYPK